ncbi:MAG: pYEATS domain-containing protein [Candidatus Thorarchaeota archaeon]
MTLELKSALETNTEDRIKYAVFRPGGREHFNLRIWLDGEREELGKVKSVDYELHPTFLERRHHSDDSNNNFAILIWTWGMFMITATVHFHDGAKEVLKYYLSYELPLDTGTNYVKLQPNQIV